MYSKLRLFVKRSTSSEENCFLDVSWRDITDQEKEIRH